MRLASRQICSGCAACQAVCAAGAIAMTPDEEGFLYPVVDPAKCVRCGRCRNACPSLGRLKARHPLQAFAVRAKDRSLRTASSSGGVFSLLAEMTLAAGGVVFGAVWTRDWSVAHAKAETAAELAAMRGSKYLQSRMDGVYAAVRAELAKGRRVLFSGTPCQVAALRGFLGGDDERLLAVEVMCHAAVSPRAWFAYLRARSEEWRPGSGQGDVSANFTGMTFRDKRDGWSHSAVCLRFSDGSSYRRRQSEDLYMWAYCAHLITRPSCHACRMRHFRSSADMTIGDFWGVGNHHRELMDDLGVSAVFANTDRGRAALERILPSCDFAVTTPERVAELNPILFVSAKAHGDRHEFLCRIGEENFDRVFAELASRRRKSAARRFADWILERIIR